MSILACGALIASFFVFLEISEPFTVGRYLHVDIDPFATILVALQCPAYLDHKLLRADAKVWHGQQASHWPEHQTTFQFSQKALPSAAMLEVLLPRSRGEVEEKEETFIRRFGTRKIKSSTRSDTYKNK